MQDEDTGYGYRTVAGAKVVRGKGCEESFRAAVDKDYNKHVVDPNHRSEIGAKKHWLLDPPTTDGEVDGFSNVRGGPRQSSLNAALDRKKVVKKKPGILKGIGSMFRFGKHRKMDFNSHDHFQQTEEFNHDNYPVEQENDTQTVDVNHNPNERMQEQMMQQQQQQQREQIYQRHGFVHRHAEQVQVIMLCLHDTAVRLTN